MTVGFEPTPPSKLLPVAGIQLGIAEAGVRKANRKDLCLILLDSGCSVGGVFTENRFCAAPVQICRSHLGATQADIRALVINTGNANAGTGADGLQRAEAVCQSLAQNLGVPATSILPFSTGVIMETLPHDKIIAALPRAIAAAKASDWGLAAEAIMTTDTVPKAISKQVQVDGKTVTISGISKGAGMIRPNMATMLGFIATDATIPQALMPALTRYLADASFNCISIDGDTSTNDSFIFMASNRVAAGAPQALSAPGNPDRLSPEAATHPLVQALVEVAQFLAQAIVRDGEGATKFIEINVEGGNTIAECRQVAYAIAHSPLVKTAFFASDPNLGRILAATGYAGIADLDQSKIDLYLGDVLVVKQGGRASSYQESDGQRVMAQSEIGVRVVLGRGLEQARVWTCDLSYDYVRINADYRS